MKKCSFNLAIIFCLLSAFAFGQSKSALKQQQSNLKKEISKLNSLLSETDVNKKKSEIEIIITKKKIGAREELINSINYEIILINKEIKEENQRIDSLKAQLEVLRDQYKKMVVYAYKNRNATNQLVFIFSSNDFNQAYKRLKYIHEIGEYREYQAEQINQAQKEIEKRIEELEEKRKRKEKLLDNKQQEKIQLRNEEEQLKGVYAELRQNEAKIRREIDEKKKERQRLNKEIERIIQRELAIAREKARKEAEAKAKEKGKETEPGYEFKLSPQAQALSADFESNKGKLPWPVSRGTISMHYGNSRHAVLTDLTVINNGINFLTNKGSKAKAVFGGTVVAVIVLPNGKNAVLLQHGSYFTMYSNLSKTLVKKNQEVSVGQELGTIRTDEDGNTELHFEVWKEGDKQNPELWIVKG
jgi:septal ring factor EnvC (AmiA/AmiB activator)